MRYQENQDLLKAAIQGYVAADRGEFPPRNPYAICGILPGRGEENPVGSAWFFGFWERAYCRNGEPRVNTGALKREDAERSKQ